LITCEGTKDLARSLRENKSLLEIYLFGNKIADDGAIHLAQSLSDNQTLIALHLYSNRIEDMGAIAFAKSLKTSKLQYLYLSGKRWDD
jgi:hypothetical protein